MRTVTWRCTLALMVLLCVVSVDAAQARSRFRPMPGHDDILEDRASGTYPHAHCQLRVPLARDLPAPLTTEAHGDLLRKTFITRATMESAGIDLTHVRIADGWRTWLWRERAVPVRLADDNLFSVKVNWPQPDGTLRADPTEIFRLPALEAYPLYHWSPWQRAQHVRTGEHVEYQAMQGASAEVPAPAPQHPFELRCRTVLSPHIAVPAEAEDANIDAGEDGHAAAPRGR